MSRTVRRTRFNRKSRFFQHYWEEFSEQAVTENSYIDSWKYHSDNYYTKRYKDSKQFLKTQSYKKLRKEFKQKVLTDLVFHEDIVLSSHKAKSIKWDLH